MSKIGNPGDFRVPMVIPFRDRVGYLKKLLHWAGNGQSLVKRIAIFDMDSTYPKAKEYLAQLAADGYVGEDRIPVTVYICSNGGARSLFSDPFATPLLKQFVAPNERFILTDPDVVPELEDRRFLLIRAMHNVLDEHPKIDKVGCALRIDDLPDHFPQKENVIQWERRFWQYPVGGLHRYTGALYRADVATTFCMVRRIGALDRQANGKALRIGNEFTAKHLPWYEDPSNLSPDLIHYYTSTPMRRWGNTGPGVSWSPLEGPNR